MLELLIVLVIVALVTSLAASAFVPRTENADPGPDRASVLQAQSEAMRNGASVFLPVGAVTKPRLSELLRGIVTLCVATGPRSDQPRVILLGSGAALVSGDPSLLPDDCLRLDVGS